MSPEITCACFAARHVARLVTQLYDEELREQVAMPQFGMLTVIEKLPGCNQATLARALDFDKTTLSRNLKLLERNGWIAHAASQDQRERGYRLTPEGSKVLRAAKPAWKRAQRRLQDAMSASEWDGMWQSFGDISKAVRQARQNSSRV
jgi:DNA-binding MarR family transcriptional regulator